jgi:hypothetical protein
VREKVAFYASTPAYKVVLDLHGWGDLHDELHALSRRGGWSEMSALIDDDMLRAFAVIGDPPSAAQQLRERYAPYVDRASFYAPYVLDGDLLADVVGRL